MPLSTNSLPNNLNNFNFYNKKSKKEVNSTSTHKNSNSSGNSVISSSTEVYELKISSDNTKTALKDENVRLLHLSNNLKQQAHLSQSNFSKSNNFLVNSVDKNNNYSNSNISNHGHLSSDLGNSQKSIGKMHKNSYWLWVWETR